MEHHPRGKWNRSRRVRLESSAVVGRHTQSRAPRLLPVLKDLTASSPRSTSFFPRASSTRGRFWPAARPACRTLRERFLRPQKQRNPPELLTSQRFYLFFFFSPVAAGKSFPLLLVQVGQNYCRESLRLPSPCAMQSQGRNGFMGTPCCLASDFPPKYGIGKRLEGYGCDLHTALLSSAISLKNQPFNCGHISTSPNLLIIDSW